MNGGFGLVLDGSEVKIRSINFTEIKSYASFHSLEPINSIK